MSSPSAEYRASPASALRRLRRRFRGLVHLRRRRGECPACEGWLAFTSRLNSLPSVQDIGCALAQEVGRVSGATSIAVYLRAGGEPVYHLSASLGTARFAPFIEGGAASALLPPDLLGSATAAPLSGALVVALRWHTAAVGFIIVGPPRGGTNYGATDAEILAAMSQQAAAAIIAIQLSDGPSAAIATQPLIHDLKNSVSALSMLARNAANSLANPEFQRDALLTLSSTVDRMRRLLARLSSPGSEGISPAPELIDVGRLIRDAAAALAVESRIQLVRRLQPAVIVRGDAEALHGAISNLLINAVEAIEHEGTITVTLDESEGHAIISVADTGRGIARELTERDLFSPVRSTKRGGWGVGLHHTKQAIARHGGEISVESVEGRGTTFTIRLPLRAPIDSAPLEALR